ncbi:MAG TPA: radical SAM protein [Thermoplasmatales archaeon]|nr:radical SAM protein [Candidatus Thermoplasmatota archaeon]HDS58889.1 radical SAM protein [Thermoplasmatales archaeon]
MNSLRVSAATATALGLRQWKVDVSPTTLYLMLGERCRGACRYCTQGHGHLSRVRWPPMSLDEVLRSLPGQHGARRLCLQTLFYDGVVDDVVRVAELLAGPLPLSVSMNPTTPENLERLRAAGVERVGIGLDCCSQALFYRLKHGVPSWDAYWEGLQGAAEVFGGATAHLIIGLGENDREAVETMQRLQEMSVDSALFAYFPLRRDRPPPLARYRALQAARHLVSTGRGHFIFDSRGRLEHLEGPLGPAAFETSGCPFCNRPFYTERAGGPLYNYPRPLTAQEYKNAVKEVYHYVGPAAVAE